MAREHKNHYADLAADYSRPNLVSADTKKTMMRLAEEYRTMKEPFLPAIAPDYTAKQIEQENRDWWPTHCEALRQGRGDRRVYEPRRTKLVIVAEPPPSSGRYFYDPTGAITEPLFSALMRQLNVPVDTKEAALREFQRQGWVLVDATYQPVNTLTASGRNEVIHTNYPSLRRDLRDLIGGRPTPLLLLKANVCRILEPKLAADGFNVINGGRIVYFPSTGQQLKFHGQFAEILSAAVLPSDSVDRPRAGRKRATANCR